MMPKQTEKVRRHVVITVAGRQYGDPIPMDRDKIITVKQENGAINRIHITPEYVEMESSVRQKFESCCHLISSPPPRAAG